MKSRSRRGGRSAAVRSPATTHLDRGRAAYEARRWREAAERLAAADRAEPLSGIDLEHLAWSYGLSGQTDLLLATLERLHDLHVEAGALREAARAGFWLGFRLLFLGEMGRGTGWIASAHRLLDRTGEDCVERGYLLLPDGLERLARKDAAGALEAGRHASAIGQRFDDPTSRVWRGRSRVRRWLRSGSTTPGSRCSMRPSSPPPRDDWGRWRPGSSIAP